MDHSFTRCAFRTDIWDRDLIFAGTSSLHHHSGERIHSKCNNKFKSAEKYLLFLFIADSMDQMKIIFLFSFPLFLSLSLSLSLSRILSAVDANIIHQILRRPRNSIPLQFAIRTMAASSPAKGHRTDAGWVCSDLSAQTRHVEMQTWSRIN